MSQYDPTHPEHLAGVHAATRPDIFAAHADRIDLFINGVEQAWRDSTPAGQQLAPVAEMALTSIRAALDLLGEHTEQVRPVHVPAPLAAVA